MKGIVPRRRMLVATMAVTLLAAGGAGAAAPVRVVITATSDAAALRPHLDERLRRRGIPLELRQDSVAPATMLETDTQAGEPLLRVWIDLDDPAEARLVFAHPLRTRFAIRRVELPAGLDEVARESIAIVVDAAIGSLAQGATFELTRAEAARVLVTAPAAPTIAAMPAALPSALPALSLRALYGVAVFAPASLPLQHGPGVTLSYTRVTGVRWSMLAQYLMESELGRQPLDVRFRTVAARLGCSARPRCLGPFCARMGVDGGLDVSWVTPFATNTARALAAPGAAVLSPMLRARLAASLPRFPGAPALMLSLDGDLLGSRYTVLRAGERATLAAPWRIRPAAALEVGWP